MQKVPKLPAIGFIGNYTYVIDSKNRVCIPPDFVDILDTRYKDYHRTVVSFISLNGSIAVYPCANYFRFLESIHQKSILDRKMRQLLTFIQGSSDVYTLDSQKRLRLKEELLLQTGILSKYESSKSQNREVYIKGFTDHFEIWPKAKWHDFVEKTIYNMDDISDEIAKSTQILQKEAFRLDGESDKGQKS